MNNQQRAVGHVTWRTRLSVTMTSTIARRFENFETQISYKQVQNFCVKKIYIVWKQNINQQKKLLWIFSISYHFTSFIYFLSLLLFCPTDLTSTGMWIPFSAELYSQVRLETQRMKMIYVSKQTHKVNLCSVNQPAAPPLISVSVVHITDLALVLASWSTFN